MPSRATGAWAGCEGGAALRGVAEYRPSPLHLFEFVLRVGTKLGQVFGNAVRVVLAGHLQISRTDLLGAG